MQLESKNNYNEIDKDQKAELIEQMLDEVGMSKEELIDLLTGVVELEESQSIDLEDNKIFLIGSDQNPESNGRSEISEVLSEDQMFDMVNRIGLASALLQSQKLGLELDDEIAEIFGLKEDKKLDFKKFAENLKNLSKDQIQKFKKVIEEQLKKFQKAEKKGFVGRFVDKFKHGAKKSSDKLKNTLHILDYNADIERLKETARDIESANSSLKNFEKGIRQEFPEVGRIKYKDGKVLASIDGLTSMVDLKEYIRSKGELTEELAQKISDAASTASNMQRNIASLKNELGEDIENIGFDKSGKLVVEKQVEGLKKKIHVQDYLGDLDRLSVEKMRMRNKADDDRDLKKALDLEEFELEHQVDELEEEVEKRDVEIKKETKHTKDDLVKLDIIADKAKLVEAQKLMREGMKEMKNAEKNKDLLNDIKKQMQRDRELEK